MVLPTGPYRLAINPLGRDNDWNLMAWTLLCPLYITICFLSGLQIGRTVPSINPKQFLNAAPLSATASAYLWRLWGFNRNWFQVVSLWPCNSNKIFIISLLIMESSGGDLPNIGIRSLNLQGYASLLSNKHNPSKPLNVLPCGHLINSGICKISSRRGVFFLTRNLTMHSSMEGDDRQY